MEKTVSARLIYYDKRFDHFTGHLNFVTPSGTQKNCVCAKLQAQS